MSKLSKRAISILVIAVFMMSIFAVIPVNADPIAITDIYDTLDVPITTDVFFGDTVVVKGEFVTSAALVNVYWDYVTLAGQMNSTLGEPAGTFEVWLDVPEATAGDHYIWVKDVGSNQVDSILITVASFVKLSPSSGLPGDDIDVNGYGFDADTEISMIFAAPSTPVAGELVGTGDGTNKIFQLDDYPVVAASETLSAPGIGEAVWTTAGLTALPTAITVTAPTNTADFTAGLYDAAGTVELVAPVASTGDDVTDDAVVLTHTFAASTVYTVKITVADETGSYALSDDGNLPGSGGPITISTYTYTITTEYTINYATGAITFAFAPVLGETISADYSYGISIDMTPSTSPETDDLGSFKSSFNVPTVSYGDEYDLTVTGVYTVVVDFIVGASISLTPDEGTTGTRVTVSGRGWTIGNTITFSTGGNPVEVVGGTVVTVVSGGKFSANVVIPGIGVTEGDISILATEVGTAPKDPSSDTFEVTGLPEIVVTPTYGSPGASITVKGYNFTQIAGTDVVIELWGKSPNPLGKKADLVTVETNSDGTFEDTFISPAVSFLGYDVRAYDTVYHMYADDAFKVGLIALIINPVYGEAGTRLSITGIGFAPGDYNITFGTQVYEDYGSGVSTGEAISDTFYVPNVPTGIYDIIITDTDENEMPVEFRVTAVTEVTLDPAMAPNKYNLTIEGCNFADKELEGVEFVLYNATDEWDMNVLQGSETVNAPVVTDDDGNFTAWWEVLNEDTLSLGDYTVNVTGYDDFFLQIPFSVVEARVSVAPRKALFDRGDTIQFNVKNDFDFKESYMKIWDPYDNLYWQTETFTTWVKAGDLYTVPYYLQTSGKNPMELSQDAPLGPWTYVFYETGTTQLTNGTFVVGPSAEALITEQIQALSDELGIDIDTLRTYIDDLGIDMDDAVSMMAEDIAAAVSGMAGDIAGLSDDLDDAVSGMQDDISGMGTKMDSIETMMDDITATSGDAQAAANEAASSADAALEAAEANRQQTSGLTGLVYGAIGASLIAALAAIVSLMQISRRIAG